MLKTLVTRKLENSLTDFNSIFSYHFSTLWFRVLFTASKLSFKKKKSRRNISLSMKVIEEKLVKGKEKPSRGDERG